MNSNLTPSELSLLESSLQKLFTIAEAFNIRLASDARFTAYEEALKEFILSSR